MSGQTDNSIRRQELPGMSYTDSRGTPCRDGPREVFENSALGDSIASGEGLRPTWPRWPGGMALQKSGKRSGEARKAIQETRRTKPFRTQPLLVLRKRVNVDPFGVTDTERTQFRVGSGTERGRSL